MLIRRRAKEITDFHCTSAYTRSHSRDALPGHEERSLAGVVMRFLALGLCLASTLLVSQTGLGSEVVLPPGTAVSVKLSDTIDSFRDPSGKQYAAAVDAPVKLAGGQTIASGSKATVVLIHNNSGWVTRLATLTVNGRQFQVSSGAGVLPGKAAPEVGTLQKIGFVSTPVVTSGPRLVLASSTELRFSLIGSDKPAPVSTASLRPHSPARAGKSLPASTEVSEQAPGIPYLCRALDNSSRVLPVSYYAADVFRTSDSPASVERQWKEFLAATYPYRFANNPHAIIQCTRLDDSATELDARQQVVNESKSENARIIETRWHYRLGPPPPAASASAIATGR